MNTHVSIAFYLTMLRNVSSFTFIPSSSISIANVDKHISARTSFTQLGSEPTDESEGGLDLDLEEMFEMFDAADKGKDFDATVKKVKGEN